MFYVGIDIAKHNHEICILDASGESVDSLRKVPNSIAGAESLIAALGRLDLAPSDCLVGMEATGHYWLAFYSYLMGKGFNLKVINPIVTDAYRSMQVRKVKTDPVDAKVIAKVLMLGEYSESPVANGETLALRQLCRFRSYEVDACSDLKRKAIAILDQIFPEYETLFSDTFGVSSREVLTSYATPEDLEKISTRKLTNLLAKASRGHFGKDKAMQLKETAMNSIGITVAVDAFAFQLKQILEQVSFIEAQVKNLDIEITRYMQESDTYIMTIPGIGPVLGAIILGEIGDIHRFSDGSKLVAYAGIDASVRQSGAFQGSKMSMSKRGSPYLRRAVYMAAMVASFSDPELAAFYQKLRSRGKHYKVAVGAVARKLCFIIFSVLSENRPYEKR